MVRSNSQVVNSHTTILSDRDKTTVLGLGEEFRWIRQFHGNSYLVVEVGNPVVGKVLGDDTRRASRLLSRLVVHPTGASATVQASRQLFCADAPTSTPRDRLCFTKEQSRAVLTQNQSHCLP